MEPVPPGVYFAKDFRRIILYDKSEKERPRPTVQIFGGDFAEGRRIFSSKGTNVEYTVEKCRTGFKVTGKARGRLGRIEGFRGTAPRGFLLNNWQSWGPPQKKRRGGGDA